jgi:hypothetical protein
MHTIKQEEENDNKIKFVGKQNFANKKKLFPSLKFLPISHSKRRKIKLLP